MLIKTNSSLHIIVPFLLFFLFFTLEVGPAQVVVKKEVNDKTMLWIEAESGNIQHPMKVWEHAQASGGQYIEVIGGNNNTQQAPEDGRATYNFNLDKAGIYKVWGRVKIDMDDEDAFWVRMDEGPWIRWQDIEVDCHWHWDEVHDNKNQNKVMKYRLGAGPHTLSFTYCMDQSRLDKLLITDDLTFVPMESGPRAEAAMKINSATPVVNKTILFDGSASFSTEGKLNHFRWELGDGTSASGPVNSHAYLKSGDYQVTLFVADEKGLTGRLTKQITVYTKDPVAILEYFPDRPKIGQSITFNAKGSFDPDGQIIKYAWDFGDGSIAAGASAEHSYRAAGEYFVTLNITDDSGNTVSRKRLVTVITGVPKKVIFETDMCLDVDDVGALAVLHAMANHGEVELLAVCFNEVHPFGAPAIDAINTWYGRGNIPIGIYKKSLADPDYSPYLEPVSKFPHDLDQSQALSALEVYRKVLSEQPDGSVTIISVGFLNNLDDLLKAEPELVARKVKELVQMGGLNYDGFNLSRHNLVSASENVIRNWPTPIVISQPGGNIKTGTGLADSPEENPVRQAYYKFFHDNFCERPSWDQMAVLYGVRGLSDYFSMNTTTTGTLRSGYKYQMKPGYRSFLEPLLSPQAYAEIIQDLMLEAPIK